MPAYHSRFLDTSQAGDWDVACGCAILPLKTPSRGPAPHCEQDQEDIVDEALYLFRANCLFRNFEVKGPADRTLIYLTFFTQQCLRALEKETQAQAAERNLLNLAVQTIYAPGEAGWQLGTIFPSPDPGRRDEADQFKAYMKQCREELGRRLIARVFDADGQKSKWWQLFSRRKFMGKELTK